MIVSIVLLLSLFIIMLILIAKDVMERAALVLICAIISFFILIFIEKASPFVIIEFLFGTEEDGFVNFRTVLLIFGILFISTICYRTGFFQFIAFKMIQFTKGEPKKVLIMLAILTFCVSSILADSITAIILIPLTITVCRTLRMDPVPFVIIQSIYIKLGATVLPISSIPSILITANQEISFLEYFTSAGLISIGMAALSLMVYYFVQKKKLPQRQVEGLSMFLEYNAWVFVKNRRMMIISSITFGIVILCLIFIPSSFLKSDAIACTGAGFLLLINRKDSKQILQEIDFQLILYLFGIFVVTGSLQYVGLIDLLGENLSHLGIKDIGMAFLLLLWIGAIASAFIDNIPITQLLLSLVNILIGEKGSPHAKMGSLGLALGVIWGDNLSPFGDSILAINVAKQNKVEIKPLEYIKIGLPLTLFQMGVITIVILLIYETIIGLTILAIISGIIGVYIAKLKRKEKDSKVVKEKETVRLF